jgi:DNA-binding NtrC family response regulator
MMSRQLLEGAKTKIILATTVFDVVVPDIGMPTLTGIDLLKDIVWTAPDTSGLIMTGLPSVETATKALQGGAFDNLLKPIGSDDIMRAVRACRDHEKSEDRKDTPWIWEYSMSVRAPAIIN